MEPCADADYWIKKLSLQEHIEGGFYRRVYCSDLEISLEQLPTSFKGRRPIATGIYFLLKQNQFSALHRIASDELWHFYDGDPLVVYEIMANGKLNKHLMGRNFEAGEQFQCVVKAGSWFGAMVNKEGSYSLVGCTVFPGFDYEDFELAERSTLLYKYPQHESIIKKLTR
jgi:uncharacterized protein